MFVRSPIRILRLNATDAAEQLGVPFSTFRRHLNRGLDRVAEILWDEEVGTT